jgi:arylsulfatase A-like enzyme
VSTQAQIQDIMPTLMDLCGIPMMENAPLDGVSLAPVLRGKEILDRMFVVQYYLSYAPWRRRV